MDRAHVALDVRLRKKARKNRYQQILSNIKRKVYQVEYHSRKYLRKYTSHSGIWEWEVSKGDRVFLRESGSYDGRKLWVIVDFGKHDLHRKYRQAGTHFASPLQCELLT